MKILISKKDGDFTMVGWYIKENESGFYAKMTKNHDAYFKFPWKLFEFKKMEEK